MDSALPDTFSAGTTVEYVRSYPDYPPSAGWTLTLTLRLGASSLQTQAQNDGESYLVTLAAADTDDLTAGTYRWIERVTKAGVVYEVATGTVIVKPNLVTGPAGDRLEYVQTAIAALEAREAGRITDDMESVTINGRAVALIPFNEIRRYLASLRSELRAIQGDSSLTERIDVTFRAP